jgi:transposase
MSKARVARDLGISSQALTSWIAKFDASPKKAEAGEFVDAELRRLRKENELLRQERDILKKATAFFAKESE